MPTLKLRRGGQLGNNAEIEQIYEITGSSSVELDEDIADSSTDLQINVAIDVSALKGLYIESDQDITIETNNGSTPDDTINLKANSPLVWDDKSDNDNPFASGTDVTAIFVTNSSGSSANLRLLAVQDATP